MSISLQQPIDLLGQISPEKFMKEYWQRKPLLIRQAIKNFTLPISIADLKNLAKREDVESRFITRYEGEWKLKKGPIARTPSMKQNDWTLLVQSVDLHHDTVSEMAQQFRFIPDARFDDVMISLAAKGGGVGPHFDTYDVFLLQGHGQRRWRISQQKDQTLIPGLPCRILENFQVEQEWVLEPGDMLYLPPHCAHDGIAETPDCVTISFGFRTLSMANMVRGILETAADQVSINSGLGSGVYSEPAIKGFNINGYYHDKGAPATSHPAELPEQMITKALQAAQKVQLNEALATRFLGCWLTEPNLLSQFEFAEEEINIEDLPENTLIKTDRKTRLLYRQKQLFINGEAVSIPLNPLLKKLADNRVITAGEATKKSDEATFELLHRWIDDGWLVIAS
ncbi:JmjC domain-containing protein [Pelistega ratti]|uniref:JmjC domain-containing protein n=1 Tax=Pelistega ratti TaxID=2652177 RepID=UPI001358AE28|nr:cupin domain-containing protein [Pelistega ratti]